MMKNLSINSTFIKASFLVLIFIFSTVYVQQAEASNPSIDLVISWKATGDDEEFNEWISQFDATLRSYLRSWYISEFWFLINFIIDATGGPSSSYGSGGGGGGSGSGGGGSPTGLATAPLFLSTIVEPNIHFILDDSGSMGWELMIGDDVTELAPDAGIPVFEGDSRYYLHPDFHDHDDVVPPASAYSGHKAKILKMAKTAAANPGYYDPTRTYSPWPGLDTSGSPLYTDANPLAAKEYPYHSTSATVDLTANTTHKGDTMYVPVFYDWIDSNFDFDVQSSDSFTEVEIKPGNEALFLTGRTYTEEMQNFANWFQYYRKREFAAKVAIGTVINNTGGTRMGLDLLNGGHTVDTTSMSDSNNKSILLQKLYEYNSSGNTPLRSTLRQVGEMFSGNTSDASPILSATDGGSCQQNFQILMSDGYWNGSDPSGIGNEDGDADTDFDHDADGDGDGGYYSDSYSDTLADVAMYYYENDLSTLANEVPTTADVDEAEHQHLVTYTIAFGLKGSLDYEVLDPDVGEVTWPEPEEEENTAIDDLWHAAYNGRGQYLNAAFPEELSDSLTDIISDIAERSATASAVAINSAKLTTDTVIYLAEFNTYRWQGEIYAYPIVDLETGELADDPTWSAGDVITARDLSSDPRVVITYDGSDGIPFQWSDLTAFQQNDLDTTPSGATSNAAEAEARLDYIRGSRDDEGTGYNFRVRSSILSDVVNSGPVYVSQSDLTWPDFSPFPTGSGLKYSDYKLSTESRDGVIYVGANDGMLHAFDEDTGRELMAFIPNKVFSTDTKSGMHYLTDSSYEHIYFNDLTPTISDVNIDSTGSGSTAWNTILFGGLRGGGAGLYALNVSNPSSFKESNAADLVLWEFTDDDDADLGLTYSKPQIALANNGKWVAIFGNGYNNGGSGESALFIVDIEAGVDGTWSSSDYVKIKTGAGSTSSINGLSTPALADIDGNGTVDRVYAGDLEGKLWVFDLSSSSNASWNLAHTNPLFTTSGNRPITARPALSRHPSVATEATNEPNVLVYFGSGQYLESSDKTDTTTNHFYGIWDEGTSNLTVSDLQEQTYDTSFTERVLTKNAVDYSSKNGWYFNLPDTGERSVTKAVVRFNVVFFNTFVPSNSNCSGGGYGYKMAVDAETGGALDDPALDSNDDDVVDEDDLANNGSDESTVAGLRQEGYLPEPVFIEDLAFTADTATKVSEEPPLSSGRLSWQELLK